MNHSTVASGFCQLKRSLVFALPLTPFIPGIGHFTKRAFNLDPNYVFRISIDRPKYGMRLIANRIMGPGKLSFTAYEDVSVHLHSSEDVPYTVDGDLKVTVVFGTVKDLIVSVMEMTNEPNIPTVPIEQRKCRFYWEPMNRGIESLFRYYSHSTCTVECSRFAQLKYCNCTHHLMPKSAGGIKTLLFTFYFINIFCYDRPKCNLRLCWPHLFDRELW